MQANTMGLWLESCATCAFCRLLILRRARDGELANNIGARLERNPRVDRAKEIAEDC